MPFDNCPEYEWAPGRAGTGDFWRVSGTRIGSATPEQAGAVLPDSHLISPQEYFTTYLPHRTDFCYPMTARPISPESRMKPVHVAVALTLVMVVVLVAGCSGQYSSGVTPGKSTINNTTPLITDFILEKELPKSLATAPYYNVVKKESIFEGSPKIMEVKTSIPSENEAPLIAEKILEKYGGLPKDAVLSKVERVSMEKYNVKTESVEERYPQFIQVIYEQQINGAPVVGPGAEINICLGENGELLQIEKVWRHVEYAEEIPIISAAEAYKKLQNGDLLEITQSSMTGLKIFDVKLGYYAEDREHDQKVYSPVWIFYGYKQGGQSFPYMVDARRG